MKLHKLSYCKHNVDMLAEYLLSVENDFGYPLSTKVNLNDYAFKLLRNGVVYIAKVENDIAGMVGVYCNDTTNKCAYLPILSTKRKYRGQGIAGKLINDVLQYVRTVGMEKIRCDSINPVAIKLYKSKGFIPFKMEGLDVYNKVYLELFL